MPQFFYRAKNLKGQEVQGEMFAEDVSHLAKTLKEKGYFLISAKSGALQDSQRKFLRLNFASNLLGVSLAEKIFFTRNLEVMIKAGVPLPRAFSILSGQVKSKKLKSALEEISQRIIKGESLTEAFANFPDIFPRIYQETLKVGEETGKLDESLDILAFQMEREHSVKSQIKTAMVYPVVVLVMAFLIGVLMFVFVVPKMKEAFQQINIELPLTTQLMLSFSDYVINYYMTIPFVIALIIGGGWWVFKKGKGTRMLSKISLKTPLISRIVKKINSALMLRALSSLLSAGVPVVHSLEIASGTVSNSYFRESLKKAAFFVEKGKKVSEALSSYRNLYSPAVIEMIRVGEETGETSKVLSTLADFYEKEITSELKKLTSVIEPFLILIIGGIVGFFAISMMQPMFSIMKHIG